MARKTKKDTKALADALIDSGAEYAMSAEPVDHHSQLSSWEAEKEIEEAIAHLNPGDGLIGMTEAEAVELNALDNPDPSPVKSSDSEDFETPAEDHPVADVEAVVAVLEAQASTGVEPEPVHETPAEEPVQSKSFDEVIEAMPAEQVDEMVIAIDEAFKDRTSFEVAKDPTNENIHRTLKKAQKLMVTRRAAQVMLACNVSAGVVNRSIHEGSCYNVYALGKLADAIYGLTGGIIGNAINKACMRSLFAFRAADMTFTGEMARAAASDKIRVAASFKKALIRHTVSASTAPTQASSTMQALETLGIVNRLGGHKNPVYTLSDKPVVDRLEKALSMAA